MPKRYISFPLIFLIFGAILITLISGYSISEYVKTKNKLDSEAMKASVNNKKIEESKLFFNKPDTAPSETLVKVYKDKRTLELYCDQKLIGRFKIALGKEPFKDKEKQGDNRTPVGTYYICSKSKETRYTYFLGISYPSIKDAQSGLDKGIIDQNAYNRIKKAIDQNHQPPWNTPLGGAIGIHGGGTKDNWTSGSIAVSDEDINILKQYTPLKTPVEIYE